MYFMIGAGAATGNGLAAAFAANASIGTNIDTGLADDKTGALSLTIFSVGVGFAC
jgi:hypothetical protein